MPEELQATKMPSGVKVVRLGVERITKKHNVLLNCSAFRLTDQHLDGTAEGCIWLIVVIFREWSLFMWRGGLVNGEKKD
jgi:hypothetical protein